MLRNKLDTNILTIATKSKLSWINFCSALEELINKQEEEKIYYSFLYLIKYNYKAAFQLKEAMMYLGTNFFVELEQKYK